MSEYIDIPFTGASYKGRSLDKNAQECVNFYLENDPTDANDQNTLYPTPGLLLVGTAGAGAHRSREPIEFKGKSYFVIGSELIEMDSSESFTIVGTLTTTLGNVSMASNGAQGDQLIIVDGTYGYIWDGTTFSTITFGFSISPEFVVFIDSYFIVNNANTGQFYRSAINDGTSWSSLNFATAERDPDDLKAIEVNQRELWLLGEYTTEIWYNDGSDFSFAPMPNAFNEWGIAAPFSVVTADSSVLWVSKNRQGGGLILQSQGNNPTIISTRQLEYQLSTYSIIDDAVGHTYQLSGHTFYVISFPTVGRTWQYDLSTRQWSQLSSATISGRHRAFGHVFFNNTHYVGDYDNGKVYKYDLDTYSDNGTPILRKRVTQAIKKENKQLRYHQLELIFEGGVGLTTGQGSDPQAALSWSDDGGHTWSNKRYASIGKIGEYRYRVLFHHLGISRERVFKLETSDPVKYVLLGATAKISEGRH